MPFLQLGQCIVHVVSATEITKDEIIVDNTIDFNGFGESFFLFLIGIKTKPIA
jgi:hypothetical protein